MKELSTFEKIELLLFATNCPICESKIWREPRAAVGIRGRDWIYTDTDIVCLAGHRFEVGSLVSLVLHLGFQEGYSKLRKLYKRRDYEKDGS